MVGFLRKLGQRRVCLQLLVGIVILASGVVLGSGGTLLYMKNQRMLRRPPDPNRFTPERIVEHFEQKYHLTPTQVVQVKQLFEDMGARNREKYEKDRLQREADEKEMVSQMQSILTPEQFEQWKQDFEEIKKRRNRMFDRGRRRGGPRRGGPRRHEPNRPEPHRPPPPVPPEP